MTHVPKRLAVQLADDRLVAVRQFAERTRRGVADGNLDKARYDADNARSKLLEAIAFLGPFNQCTQCGEEFLALRADALTCSARCRTAKHRARAKAAPQ